MKFNEKAQLVDMSTSDSHIHYYSHLSASFLSRYMYILFLGNIPREKYNLHISQN